MPEMIMLIGIPASGKSSVAKTYKSRGYVIHSSDAIRDELRMDTYNPDKNNEVFDILRDRIISDLRCGKDVVYDACNISYKKRMCFLSLIKQIDCQKTAIFMATPFEECIKGNHERKNSVPDQAIDRMYKNIYIPYYYEGWDKIIIYKYKNFTEISLKTLFEDKPNGLDYINQDNPHHIYTVGIHCRKTADYIKQKYPNATDAVYEAALLHDIGKSSTKTFYNMHGELDTIAHYYQHNFVSAYMSLFVESPKNVDMLERAVLIQWHMQPYSIQSNKAESKYRKLWGNKIYYNIDLLHKADMSAP